MDDVDALAKDFSSRHYKVEDKQWGFDSDGDYSCYYGPDKCSLDGQLWPCDAQKALNLLQSRWNRGHEHWSSPQVQTARPQAI